MLKIFSGDLLSLDFKHEFEKKHFILKEITVNIGLPTSNYKTKDALFQEIIIDIYK